MEQIPSWEANSQSASQKISRLLWYPKVHFCVHKSLQLDPILGHINPGHTLTPYYLRTILIIL